MNCRFFTRIFPVLLLIQAGLSQVILHEEIQTLVPGEAPAFTAAVSELTDLSGARLLLKYRHPGESQYQELPLQNIQDNLFELTLPAGSGSSGGLEYYLLLYLPDGSEFTYPLQNAEQDPIVVDASHVETPGLDAYFIVPEPGAMIEAEEAMILFSFFGMPDVDPTGIRLLINGIDVTSQAEIRSNHLVYAPDRLSSGTQNIEIQLPGTARPIQWSFTARGEDMPVSYLDRSRHSGNLSADVTSSAVDDEDATVGNLYVNHKMDMDAVKVRTRLRFSSLENADKQPRNRYLVDVRFPYGHVKFGDVHPAINPFAMKGNRLRGLELAMDFKAVNFTFASGSLARAVNGYPQSGSMFIPETGLQNILAHEDSLNLIFDRRNYTFKRDITALNVGFGRATHFQWNFNFVKAKDDVNSVKTALAGARIELPEDLADLVSNDGKEYLDEQIDDGITTYSTTFRNLQEHAEDIFDDGRDITLNLLKDDWAGARPNDNIVIGTDFILNFHDRRIRYRSGVSFSMLNRNIWEPLLSEELLEEQLDEDITLPFDPEDYENIFYMSLNQVPLVPIDVSSDASGFEKVAKMPSLAYNSELSLRYFGHVLEFKFRQVGPEFNSLANPFLQKNIRERIIADRMKFLQNRLYLVLKYIHTDDDINLSHETVTESNRFAVNAAYYPGVDLPTINLGFQIEGREAGAAENMQGDSLGVANQEDSHSTVFSLSITDSFDFYGSQHLSFNYFKADKTDLLPDDVLENELYFSPESHSQNLSLIIRTVMNALWESRFVMNYAYYNYGLESTYASQSLNLIQYTVYRSIPDVNAVVHAGLGNSVGNGNASFAQFSLRLGGIWQIRPDLKLVSEYEFRNKSVTDGDSYANSFFNARLSYQF